MTEQEELNFLRQFLVNNFELNTNPGPHCGDLLKFGYIGNEGSTQDCLDDGGDSDFRLKLLQAYRNACPDPEAFDLRVIHLQEQNFGS